MSLDAWIEGDAVCHYCGQRDCQCPPDEPEDDHAICPKCKGSGLSLEGWDCWFCEGYGFLDI
jgi:hypothetical protein